MLLRYNLMIDRYKISHVFQTRNYPRNSYLILTIIPYRRIYICKVYDFSTFILNIYSISIDSLIYVNYRDILILRFNIITIMISVNIPTRDPLDWFWRFITSNLFLTTSHEMIFIVYIVRKRLRIVCLIIQIFFCLIIKSYWRSSTI